MKNGLVIFLGVFATLALSWAGVLLAAHKQIGALPQYKDEIDASLYPAPLTGIADQGRLVYQDLGCATCHTQQVRYEGFGSDIKRGWGERGSFARDYIREKSVLIGSSRIGPDLRNVAARSYASAEYFHELLYAPEVVAPGTNMPAHKFLYEIRPLAGNQPSHKAIKLSSQAAPGDGFEVVPTPRAEALVAYLMNLKDSYNYPDEEKLNAPAPAKEGGH